ncbi:CheY-like superfamily [Chlamydoabsidia padenii]|nr:CheY-like superfamily [Chlamydoabsidia padenii]
MFFDIQHMDLAHGGQQALHLLEHQLYDVILLDIDMPGLNGVETTQLIRKQHSISPILDANKTIPIIAVTTSDSLEARLMYRKVGMDACLSKPIIPSQLKSQLLELLEPSPISL